MIPQLGNFDTPFDGTDLGTDAVILQTVPYDPSTYGAVRSPTE
jgi:hypothetical protein